MNSVMDTTNPLLAPLLVTLAFLAACLVRLHVEGVFSARRRKARGTERLFQSSSFQLLEKVLFEFRDVLHDDFNGGIPGPEPYRTIESHVHRWLHDLGCASDGEPMSLRALVRRSGELDLRMLRIDDKALEITLLGLDRFDALVQASNDEEFRVLWEKRTVLSIISMLRVCHTAKWRQIVHDRTGRRLVSPESVAKWRSVEEMWKQLSLAYEELDEPHTRAAMEVWRAKGHSTAAWNPPAQEGASA